MSEFYVKYRYPKVLFEFEPEYDIPNSDIDKGECVEIFLNDVTGRVMVFQSQKHAEAQIETEKATNWKFNRWAKDIRIICTWGGKRRKITDTQ